MNLFLLTFLVASISPQIPPHDIPTLRPLASSSQAPFVGLSVTTAVAMALSKNPDMTVAQENRRIAMYRIVAARGAYDVSLRITPSYSFTQHPVIANIFSGPGVTPLQRGEYQTEMSLSGRTRSGMQYTLGGSSATVYDNTSLNNYDPFYTTSLSLHLLQPLLRGTATDDAKLHLELARVGADLATQQMSLVASNTLAHVLGTYYDLMAAWRKVSIQEEGLLQAQNLSDQSARLLKIKKNVPANVIESDAQVYKFRNRIFSALQKVVQLQNELKQLILLDPDDPIWEANIVPISPLAVKAPELSLSDIIASAMKNRPEIAQLRESSRSAELDRAYATEQAKPQIDLNLELTENGFAGALANPAINPVNFLLPPGVLPLPPGYENGKAGQSWSNALNGRFPRYMLGVTIVLPLQNHAARGNIAIASAQEKSINVQQIALIQRLRAQAREAVQSCRLASERVNTTKAQRSDMELILQDEERKFASGRSLPLLVLARQLSAISAREDELQAQADLQAALIAVDEASGTLLQHYNVKIIE